MVPLLKFALQGAQSGYGVLKKILLVLIVFIGFFSLFNYFIFEQKAPPQIDVEALYQKELYRMINTPPADLTDEQKTYMSVTRALLCGFTGEACANSPEESQKFVRNSLLGRVSGWIATPVSHPPASGVVWAHESLAKAGLVPQVHAAEGIGFSSIRGYMGIWSLFRNISYMLFVMFILIVGFLIMFRVQLGGGSVAIESALPRIVVSLLVITFSFAIAGFLIDLMYVVTSLGISILHKTGHLKFLYNNSDIGTLAYFQKEYLYAGFNELFPPMFSSYTAGNAMWELLPETIQGILDVAIMLPLKHYTVDAWFKMPHDALTSFEGVQAAAFSWGRLTGWAKIAVNAIAYFVVSPYIPGLVLGLLISLTVLFNVFKIFFIVLGSYLKIILYIIFAPFILLFDIIPGNGTLGWWLRNLIGELLVTPTIILIFLSGRVIMHANSTNIAAVYCRDNPACIAWYDYDSGFRLPFMHGFQADDLNMLVGLGIILLIPDFVKMVKGWVGVRDMGLNFGLGTFFGGMSVFTGGLGAFGAYQGMRRSLFGYDVKQGEKGLSSYPGFGWLSRFEGK